MKNRCAIALTALLLASSGAHADALDSFYRNPVYQTAPDGKSCQALAQGVPTRMGITPDTRQDAKVFLGGQAAVIMWRKAEDDIRSSYFYLNKEQCEHLELQIEPPERRVDPDEYVAKLKAKYDSRLHFQSAHAEQVIRNYRIDCAIPIYKDRYVPLINILYMSLSSIDRPDVWLEIIVEDQDGNIRTLNDFRGPKAPADANSGPQRIGVQIDKTGRMQPLRSASIVDSACSGYSGPVWRNK